MGGEVPAAADPDVISILDVGKKSLETPDPSRVPKDSSVHTLRHHPWVHRSLRDELVEGINEEFFESPPSHQRATDELRVSRHQRVRND